MREIVRVMLEEGLDEDTIHEALAIIAERYEIVDESEKVETYVKAKKKLAQKQVEAARDAYEKNPTKQTFITLGSAQDKLRKYDNIQDVAQGTKIKGQTKGTELTDKKTSKPIDFTEKAWNKRMDKETMDDKKGDTTLTYKKYKSLPEKITH